MRITYFDIEGKYSIRCKMFSPESSTKGVVIGVHGFAGDKESSAIEAVAYSLKNNYAVLSFDFPAHGTSPASDNALRVDNCKHDLLTVFQYVQNAFPEVPVSIFATSFGGYITLLLLDYEEFRPEKVVLRAPAIKMAQIFRDKIVGNDFALYQKQRSIRCGFDRIMNVSMDFYEDLTSNDAFCVKPELPLLMFCAAEDELVDSLDLHLFAERNPNVRMIEVKGATHRFKGPGELDYVVRETVKWIAEER